MYRIVETDNFGGDYPNESYVGPWLASKETAQAVADLLNGDASGPSASRYWKVVEEGYSLVGGFEP